MVLGCILATTSLSASILYLYQNKLVYPSWAKGARKHVENPESFGIPHQRKLLVTDDNIKLEAYDMKNLKSGNNQTTVLILCPNAGNIGYYLPIASIFYHTFNMSVLLYSYRGYGNSNGSPSENGLKKDADCVIKYLLNDDFHKYNKILLFGQSLGGANAIYISSKYPDLIDGIIVENTFLSIPKVIPYMLPYLKLFTKFCHEIWNSEKDIEKINSFTPFLFLSGLKDEKVPPDHMKKLYDLCPSSEKNLIEFPLGYHTNTISQDGYWDIIEEFLLKYGFLKKNKESIQIIDTSLIKQQ